MVTTTKMSWESWNGPLRKLVFKVVCIKLNKKNDFRKFSKLYKSKNPQKLTDFEGVFCFWYVKKIRVTWACLVLNWQFLKIYSFCLDQKWPKKTFWYFYCMGGYFIYTFMVSYLNMIFLNNRIPDVVLKFKIGHYDQNVVRIMKWSA